MVGSTDRRFEYRPLIEVAVGGRFRVFFKELAMVAGSLSSNGTPSASAANNDVVGIYQIAEEVSIQPAYTERYVENSIATVKSPEMAIIGAHKRSRSAGVKK